MRKRCIVLCINLITMVFLTSNVFAAGVDLTGIGARAQALGGNFRAVANDWSAMYWNPAGMVFNEGITAGASMELISVGVGYTPARSLAGQQFSATSNTEIENEPKTFVVPSGGIYYSNGKYAFGIGVWAPFGLGAKWDLLNTSAYNSAYPEFDYDDDLQVLDIHPTFAYKVSDKFSVGFGASILVANIMIQKPNFTPNPYIYSPSLAQAAAALPANAKNSPYDHLLTDTILDSDTGTGFGANFGIMYKPTETFTIGVSMQYYADVSLTGTVDAVTYFATDPVAHGTIQQGLKPIFDQMLANKQLTQSTYGTLLNYYSGGSFTRANGIEIETDMPLPLKVGIGVSYTGIQNLQISADVAFTQWSSWDVIDIKDTSGATYTQLIENWEDGLRIGVGLDYSFSKLKLRGAAYTEPPGAIESTMTPTIPDFSRRYVGIIGLEYPVGPLKVLASYEKIFMGDTDVSSWELSPDGTAYEKYGRFLYHGCQSVHAWL